MSYVAKLEMLLLGDVDIHLTNEVEVLMLA